MKQAHTFDTLPRIPGAKVAIIQSKWHREMSDMMVKKCCEVLAVAGITNPAIHILPGSLELPLAAQDLARNDPQLEAIIAFGIIIKGDTDHYDVVRDECTRGLGAVSLACSIPILMEIIPVTDIKFARARCADDEFNKGIEAAVAAVEMIHWRRSQRK